MSDRGFSRLRFAGARRCLGRPLGMHLWRALRVAGLLALMTVFSLTILGRALAQEVQQIAVQGGRAVWGLALPHRANDVQTLVLNGMELFVRTATVEESLERVIAEAHRTCAVRGFGVPSTLRRILGADGVFDERGEREGTVACFEAAPASDFFDFAKRWKEVLEAGDIGALGRFRYLYARQESESRTVVLSLWAEDALRFRSLFPADGDAPGTDDPGLPRPQGARRILSVSHAAMRFPLVIHEVEAPMEQLEEAYADDLRRAGLQVDLPPDERTVGEEKAGAQQRLWTVRSAGQTRLLALLRERGRTWLVSMPLP